MERCEKVDTLILSKWRFNCQTAAAAAEQKPTATTTAKLLVNNKRNQIQVRLGSNFFVIHFLSIFGWYGLVMRWRAQYENMCMLYGVFCLWNEIVSQHNKYTRALDNINLILYIQLIINIMRMCVPSDVFTQIN